MKYPNIWKIAALLVSQACFTPALAAPAKGVTTGRGYTVKSGDTFAKIARTNGVSLGDLLKANRVSNPDRIQLGQRITIPGAKAAAKLPQPAKPVAVKKPAKSAAGTAAAQPSRTVANTVVDITPPPVPGSYVVQSGDTLSRIQHRTGTSVASLMKLNGLKETSILRPGQKLRTNSRVAVAATKPAVPVKPQPAPVSVAAVPATEEPVMTVPAAPPVHEHPAYEQPVPQHPVPQPSPQAPLPETHSTTAPHRVEAGETFSSIGRLYGLKQSRLIAANPGVNPTKIRPGQTILIPGQPARPQAQPLVVRADGRVLANRPDPLGHGVPVADVTPAERTRTGYLVEEGETLSQIAQRFHTTERELRRLNRLGDSDNIYAGRYILVPFIRQAPAGNTLARRDA